MTIFKKRLKDITSEIKPALGGISFFFILFLYGLINNFNITYMGARNKRVEDFIFDNFALYVIFFILKLLIIYLLLGALFGIIVHFALKSYLLLTGREFSPKKSILFNGVIIFSVYVFFFFRDIILYPQAYVNNFCNKNFLNRSVMNFMTDNVHPSIFTVLLIVFVLAIAGLIIVYIVRLKNRTLNSAIVGIFSIFFISFIFSSFDCGTPGDKKKPNILILATDALRPDHLSGYGYQRETSPNIDKLIEQGKSFRNAFVEVPRTFPSLISLLTGQYSSTHGVRHMMPTSRDRNRDFKTIMKILKKKGYYTAVTGDYASDIFSRVELGFDKVDTPYFNFNNILRQAVLDRHTFLWPFLTSKIGLMFFPVLKDSAYFCPPYIVRDKIYDTISETGDRPFFLMTFFSATHFPYAPPHPYYKQFAVKDYDGPYKYFKQITTSLGGEKAKTLTEKDIKQIHSLYDGGIRAFDEVFGEIMEYLADKEILENTIVILLSDHGENMFEDNHGMGHGEHLRGYYATKMPLVFRYPALGLKKKDFNELVRIVDVAPTILSLLGEPIPKTVEGVSLLPLMKGKGIEKLYAYSETGIWFDNKQMEDQFFQKLRIMYPDITIMSEVDFHFNKEVVLKDEYRDMINLAKHRSINDGRYKLIYMPMRSGVRYELYDTLKDPKELVNIVTKDRKNFKRLKSLLFKWVQRNQDVIIKKDFIFPLLRY